jgi:hypothetical protein
LTTESGSGPAPVTKTKAPLPLPVRIRKTTATLSRFLHVYLSMVSFAVVFFFAATGLTLNHPDWFANQQKTVVRHGVADAALLKPNAAGEVDKLGLVEMLRARQHIHGAVSEVRVDDAQISISARAPGYTADTFIDRSTGRYDVTEVSSGFVAVINDLHKGRDSGKTWGWLIDASAVLLVLVSLTGLVLIWFVYKRRTSGLILAVIGTVVMLAIYKWLVP